MTARRANMLMTRMKMLKKVYQISELKINGKKKVRARCTQTTHTHAPRNMQTKTHIHSTHTKHTHTHNSHTYTHKPKQRSCARIARLFLMYVSSHMCCRMNIVW